MKRRNGEGSIRQRKDGRWEARIMNSRGKSLSMYGATEHEAKAKLSELKRDLQHRRGTDKPDIHGWQTKYALRFRVTFGEYRIISDDRLPINWLNARRYFYWEVWKGSQIVGTYRSGFDRMCEWFCEEITTPDQYQSVRSAFEPEWSNHLVNCSFLEDEANKILPSEIMEDLPLGRIYMVGSYRIGHPVKIGFTGSDVWARIRSLQTGCPFKLTLMGSFTGTMDDEKRIHKHLSYYRKHGEWFDNCDPVRRVFYQACRERLEQVDDRR